MPKKIRVTKEFGEFLQAQLAVHGWVRQNPDQDIPAILKLVLIDKERQYEERKRTPTSN